MSAPQKWEFDYPYELINHGKYVMLRAHNIDIASYSVDSWGTLQACIEAAWNHAYVDADEVRTDLSQASVAAARDAAQIVAKAWISRAMHLSPDGYEIERRNGGMVEKAMSEIAALITPAQRTALAAHVAAEVAKARAEDAAKIEAAFSKALRTVTVKHDGREVGDLPYLTEDSVIDAAAFRNALAQIGAKP